MCVIFISDNQDSLELFPSQTQDKFDHLVGVRVQTQGAIVAVRSAV